MLTRCPACETNFRVTTEQLKARSGRVRCGQCQHVFNALDGLVEESVLVVPSVATGLPQPAQWDVAPIPEGPAVEEPAIEIAVSPAPTFLPAADGIDEFVELLPEPEVEASATAYPEPDQSEAADAEATQPEPTEESPSDSADWSETFPEEPPPPRRWPWVIGSLLAFSALALQAVFAFRVELAVLVPEARPALVSLCEFADCEVGLPTKVVMVGIEASDLHPDRAKPGQLTLTATLKNRAPFAQQFPHLELTLTDTADKAVARRVMGPADYLPPKAPMIDGMPPGADIAVAVAIDAGQLAASGYRLYLFYP